jgi:phosphoribosylformimino-5-aminoimidazole carboxamide ribotide isomerase
MHIIPAIDIIEGQCVRLEKGDYNKKKTYNADPLIEAKRFESMGFKKLHLVDLDGAKANRVVNLKTLERIASNTKLQIDFGGGLKTIDEARKVLSAGAYQVTGGSIAAQNRDEFLKWISEFGKDHVILGADVLHEMIMVSGWQEKTEIQLFEYLELYQEKGIEFVICTDISKDGMLEGPSLKLYKRILQRFPGLSLIASGGVTSMDDIKQLKDAGLYGAILGKAIYENRIDLEELANYVNAH